MTIVEINPSTSLFLSPHWDCSDVLWSHIVQCCRSDIYHRTAVIGFLSFHQAVPRFLFPPFFVTRVFLACFKGEIITSGLEESSSVSSAVMLYKRAVNGTNRRVAIKLPCLAQQRPPCCVQTHCDVSGSVIRSSVTSGIFFDFPTTISMVSRISHVIDYL